jgi:hypothetical protein
MMLTALSWAVQAMQISLTREDSVLPLNKSIDNIALEKRVPLSGLVYYTKKLHVCGTPNGPHYSQIYNIT